MALGIQDIMEETARLGLAVLVALSGLCTIFVSVVTAAQAWQEYAQARWPEVTARVDSCGMERTSSGRRAMDL